MPLSIYEMLSRGEGGGRGGDFDILSKIFVKNHSPGTTYFVKKTQNPHRRAGELCQMFLTRGKLFILGIHCNQTRQKNCMLLSLRKAEIILPINSTKGRGVMSNVPNQRQVIHSRHPLQPNQLQPCYINHPLFKLINNTVYALKFESNIKSNQNFSIHPQALIIVGKLTLEYRI